MWLPLPHVLNALPVQIDWMYRTGASAIAISVASFAITVACVSAIVRRISGSRTRRDPGVDALRAQSERAVSAEHADDRADVVCARGAGGAASHQWSTASTDYSATNASLRVRPAACWTIVAACLTRYEAWPIVGAAIVLAAYVKWRRGTVFTAVLHEAAQTGVFAVATVLFFIGLSFATTGTWFVTGGFYVPDPKLQGQPIAVYHAIREGVGALGGPRFVQFASYSIPIIAIAGLLRRSWSGLILPLSFIAAAALPFYAYMSGHPFIIRYEVALILGCAVVHRRCRVAAALPGARRGHTDAGAGHGAVAILRPEPCADGRRSAGRSEPQHGPAGGHGLFAAAVRQHDDHGEHGIARALPAGVVARGLRSRRFHA